MKYIRDILVSSIISLLLVVSFFYITKESTPPLSFEDELLINNVVVYDPSKVSVRAIGFKTYFDYRPFGNIEDFAPVVPPSFILPLNVTFSTTIEAIVKNPVFNEEMGD